MRPEKLTIQNIGPFIGAHTIDFSTLGDIFLIFGKTGAGKTTIFDALCYAFYGNVPGSRKDLVRQMRSQGSLDTDEASVTLEFTLGLQRYRIIRVLPGERPGKRGAKSQAIPEDVHLDQWLDSQWKDRTSTNKSETDKQIADLIRLSQEEFTRIVLLPQGEFSRFLRQNSTDRKQILSKLFPVSEYSRVIERCRSDSRDAEFLLKETETALQSLQQRFNPASAKDDLLIIQDKISDLRSQLETSGEKHRQLTALLERSRAIDGRVAERAEEIQKLADLERQTDSIAAAESRLASARKAAPLIARLESLHLLRHSIETGQHELTELQTTISRTEKDLALLESLYSDQEKRHTERDTLVLRKEKLSVATGIAQKILEEREEQSTTAHLVTELTAELKAIASNSATLTERLELLSREGESLDQCMIVHSEAKNRLDTIKLLKELSEDHRKALLSRDSYRITYTKSHTIRDELDADLAIAKAEHQEIEQLIQTQGLSEQARDLALLLHEGSPCPVCGSLTHPKPAQNSTLDAIPLQSRRDAAKRRIADLEERKAQANENIASVEASLSAVEERIANNLSRCASLLSASSILDVDPSVLEDIPRIQKLLSDSVDSMQKAQDALGATQKAIREGAAARQELHAIEAKRTQLEQRLSALERTQAQLSQSIAIKTERYKEAFPSDQGELNNKASASVEPAEAEEALASCNARILTLDAEMKQYEEELSRLRSERSTLIGKRDTQQKSITAHLAQLSESEKEFLLARQAALFPTEDAVSQAYLEEAECSRLEEQNAQWRRDRDACKSAIERLDKEVGSWQGPASHTIEEECTRLAEQSKSLSEQLEEKNAERVSLTSLCEQFAALEAQRAERSLKAGRLKALSDDLSGNNSRKISFDAWILGMYLEEITEYANLRLQRISDGRYRIQLNDSYRKGNSLAGLDLEILDSYTGKTRPTGTLSGGETFITSISLALGLADSIQSRSGGIELDAVFIDEGFGSLDEASLERAISILDEIRGTRMVGIISHVVDLRNRIPNRIEVVKTPSGSRIEKESCNE